MITRPHEDETGYEDDEDHEKKTAVGKGLHGSIKSAVFRWVLFNEEIEFDLVPRAFEVEPCEEILPVRVEPREKGEIQPPYENEHEEYPEEDMHVSHIPHEELINSLSLIDCKGVGNVKSCDNQDKNG